MRRLGSRYYSGVRCGRTTISCVAVAVILAQPVASAAQLPVASAAPAATVPIATPAPPLTFPLHASWSATLADSPSFPPAYDAAHGYFSLRNDQLVAISLEDGMPVWSVVCPTTAAPAAGSGLVFTGGTEGIESRSQKDGQLVWTRPIHGRITSLYWDAGWLLVASDKGPFSATRADDGELLWERDLGAPLHSPPSLAGDRLYLSLTDGRILALSLQTGDVLWTNTLDKPGDGILALAERLYVGSLDDYFYCLDPSDGKRKWRWRNDADVVGMPVIDTRRVYFVALDNVVRALNRNNGSLVWKKGLSMRPSSGPLLTGNLLVVAGLAAELHGYSTVDGTAAGNFELRGAQGEELQFAAPPHLTAGDTIIIVTKNGQMSALVAGPAPAPPESAPASPVVPARPLPPDSAPAAAPAATPAGAGPSPVAPATTTP
jgi:outer membrane protein assembly factor BamB